VNRGESTNLNCLDGQTGVTRGTIDDGKALTGDTVGASSSSDQTMAVHGGSTESDESDNREEAEHLM
jgi:hypothetical protein